MSETEQLDVVITKTPTGTHVRVVRNGEVLVDGDIKEPDIELIPPHHHEGWQIRDSADGGKYCAACGEKVEPGLFVMQEEDMRMMTSSERATYQALRARGVSPAQSLSDALDGVDVDTVRRMDKKEGL